MADSAIVKVQLSIFTLYIWCVWNQDELRNKQHPNIKFVQRENTYNLLGCILYINIVIKLTHYVSFDFLYSHIKIVIKYQINIFEYNRFSYK